LSRQAVPSRIREELLAEGIKQMITDGLGFLYPLADETHSISDELPEVVASTPFERLAVDSLAAYVGGNR
jgi:hypothetical protein